MFNFTFFLLIEYILEFNFCNFVCVYYLGFVVLQDVFIYFEEKKEVYKVMLVLIYKIIIYFGGKE